MSARTAFGLRQRRALCVALALGPALAAPAQEVPAPVLVLRHAATEPGIGDPPGFRLDQ